MLGRPSAKPLIDAQAARIDELITRVAAMQMTAKAHQGWTEDLLLKIVALEEANKAYSNDPTAVADHKVLDEMLYRLTKLELRVKAMNEAFSRGNIPSPAQDTYEPQFKVWPGANPSSNGS